MDLQNLERERIKRYKEYLRQEAEKSARQRKQQNNYQRKKQHANINQLIDKLNEDDVRRLQQRKITALLLKQHNTTLSSLKKNNNLQQHETSEIKNNSFLDIINSKDSQRINRAKEVNTRFTHENQAHQSMRREIQGKTKQIGRQEQEKHMRRLKQMQYQSHNNYEQIKRKHDQNIKLYEMHMDLMQENQQYRKMAEKFTQCDQDIISRLKRKNESAQRKRVYKYNQQVLKNQMGEFNQRRSLQKSQIMQGHNIDQSIFKKLMHGSPSYKKQYGEQLRYQIQQIESKRIQQKQNSKQKYKIGGIFGGQHGRQRQAQILYVDRKLGIPNKINHSQSINNEQQYTRQIKQQNKISQNESLPSIQQELHEKMHIKQLRNMKQQPVTSLIISNSKQQIKQKATTPKNNYNAYPLMPPSNQKNKNDYVYINGQNSPERKIFLSYDLVTGKNRFYG